MSPKLLNILLVLVPVALYFGYLQPFYTGVPGFVWTPEQSLSALQSKDVQYSNALQQVSLIANEAKNLNKDYTAIDDETKSKAAMLLPDTIDPVRLRNEVVSIANKSGMAFSGLKVEPDTRSTSKELGGYTVSFDVKARYPAFKKFMENYEKSRRLFILDSVGIQKSEKRDGERPNLEEDSEALDISVVSKVYYLK